MKKRLRDDSIAGLEALGVDMSDFQQDNNYARQYMGEYQLLAIRCGAIYGALALGGLIAIHLVLATPFSALGALLACGAALMAYLNFTIASSEPGSAWLGRTQILSVLLGLLSGVLVVAGAI